MKTRGIIIISGIPKFIHEIKNFLTSQKEINLLGCHSDINCMQGIITKKHPDILLLDDSCFDKDLLINFVTCTLRNNPEIKVILNTKNFEATYLKTFINLGIRSIVSGEYQDLLAAIKLVGNGVYFDSKIVFTLFKHNMLINIDDNGGDLNYLSKKTNEILLIDENQFSSSALKSYLENILMKGVNILTPFESIKNVNKKYDYVVLNLSYYCDYQYIGSIIKSLQKFQFKKLIIISNNCLQNLCILLFKKYNATILCKNNLVNKNCSNPVGWDMVNKNTETCCVKSFGKSVLKKDQSLNLEKLSEREKEVLFLIGKGYTSNTISNKLFISKRTVDFHRRNLMKKLDCQTSAEVILSTSHLSWNGEISKKLV